VETTVVLPEEVDLHARPAAELVRAAMPFNSKVRIVIDGDEADAKSLLAVLALGARRGTALRLRAQGDDAAVALAAMAACVNGFVA
jgi:phosphotransferase system HPr (HPr) family protein